MIIFLAVNIGDIGYLYSVKNVLNNVLVVQWYSLEIMYGHPYMFMSTVKMSLV